MSPAFLALKNRKKNVERVRKKRESTKFENRQGIISKNTGSIPDEEEAVKRANDRIFSDINMGLNDNRNRGRIERFRRPWIFPY